MLGRRSSGTPVLLYYCHGGDSQQWRASGNGLRNPQSNRCLTSGSPFTITDCTGGANQRWSLA
jgi:hypothetical protein